MLHFEDRDFGLIYISRPPAGISLETVLSLMISQQLMSPVPLPLEAVFESSSLQSWEETFLLQAELSGEFTSNIIAQ